MARRSVFIPRDVYPFFEEIHVDFDYFQGFALSQKRKSQISLHNNFLKAYPDYKVLEISSSSLYSLGCALSAMDLKKRTSQGVTTVESAFQSSRIYGADCEIGPFPEYLFLPGKECKKIVKEKSKGLISYHYLFDGMSFSAPAYHISLFYDYLYLNALCEPENMETAERLLESGYNAFTDLATRALNSQARSAALFTALTANGLIDQVKDYDSYLALFRTGKNGLNTGPESFENVQLLTRKGDVQLLSPVVPCTFSRAETENYYKEKCSNLTNRKDPANYLDLLT